MLIDVIVEDILEEYGILLEKKWSTNAKQGCYLLEGYHFTFPHKAMEVIIIK
jgi:hypothetical protein